MKRTIFFLLALSVPLLLAACNELTAAEPNAAGEIIIRQRDFEFVPNTIRVTAGQEITIILINEGAKEHELMIGRDPIVEGNLTEAFINDFFANVPVMVSGAGMPMGGVGATVGDVEHDMDAMDMDMNMDAPMLMPAATVEADGLTVELRTSGELPPGQEAPLEFYVTDADGNPVEGAEVALELEMLAMAMPTNQPAVMEMEAGVYRATASFAMAGPWALHLSITHAGGTTELSFDEVEVGGGEEMGDMEGMGDMEHSMGALVSPFGVLQNGLMEAHETFMVMTNRAVVTPSEQITRITFTVPADRVGRWEIGCFQESGLHYDDGMRGALIVAAP